MIHPIRKPKIIKNQDIFTSFFMIRLLCQSLYQTDRLQRTSFFETGNYMFLDRVAHFDYKNYFVKLKKLPGYFLGLLPKQLKPFDFFRVVFEKVFVSKVHPHKVFALFHNKRNFLNT